MNISLKTTIKINDKTIIAGAILAILFLKNILVVRIKLFSFLNILRKD